MFWLVGKLWIYRTEILLAIELLARLRKSAQEVAREYIRRSIETKLRHAIAVVACQILLFVALYYLNQDLPGLPAQLLASVALWLVTVFNLTELCLVTIPELRALHRTLRGKTGYALKYFLEVSLVTELMRLNILFLGFCLVVGVSSRTWIGESFSYVGPWVKLAHPERLPHRPHRTHLHPRH